MLSENISSLLVASCLIFPATTAAQSTKQCEASRYAAKPRVFVATDMSNEPDDQMSLVRFLTYANELDIQGIVGSTSVHKNSSIDEVTIRLVLQAYGNITANLNANVPSYAPFPSEQELLTKVHVGHPVYGLAALSLPPSGAALAMIAGIDAASTQNPQWHISKTRDEKSVEAFVAKVRVYSISDQDDAGPWIRAKYPSIFWIVSLHSFIEYTQASWNGISGELFRHFDKGGPDSSLITNEWLEKHIRVGVLGEHYPHYDYIMEGDTPSFLPLIQNGLGVPEHPEWGSWGGRFKALDQSRRFSTFTDTADYVRGLNGEFFLSSFATIWRWRKAYQYDFAARMQWTLSSDYVASNHAPVAIINGTCGPAHWAVPASVNNSLIFDASQSWDPDQDQLRFTWLHYRDVTARLEGVIPDEDILLTIEKLNQEGSVVKVTPTRVRTMHLILMVEDVRDLSMTTYRRIVLTQA